MAAGRIVDGEAVSKATNVESVGELQRFKPHAAYKDSGVEWLGRPPDTTGAAWPPKKDACGGVARMTRRAPIGEERAIGGGGGSSYGSRGR